MPPLSVPPLRGRQWALETVPVGALRWGGGLGAWCAAVPAFGRKGGCVWCVVLCCVMCDVLCGDVCVRWWCVGVGVVVVVGAGAGKGEGRRG